MVTTSRRGVSERKMGAAVRKSRLIAAGGTSLSVLVPLVFSAPVLSSTVTINTAASSLSVGVLSTSGGADAGNPKSVVLNGTGPMDAFPSVIGSSRAEVTYTPIPGGPHNVPVFSEANYVYTESLFRTTFDHTLAAPYRDPAPRVGDSPYFLFNSASANGAVFFTANSSGSIALSGIFDVPNFRLSEDGTSDDPAAGSYEMTFRVVLMDLTINTTVFEYDSLRELVGDKLLGATRPLVGGHAYQFIYETASSLTAGENQTYSTTGQVQLLFLSLSDPLPIPSPVSVYGGLGLMSLLAWRRPGRR